MKTYLRILSFARPFRKFLPLFIVTTLFGIIFELLNLSFVAPVLKILFSEDVVTAPLGPAPDFEMSKAYFSAMADWTKNYLLSFDDKTEALKLICAILLASVFFANLFMFFSRFILAFVKAKMVKNMRVAIYEKVNRLHLGYFTNEHRGDLISRMTNDVQEVESSIVATIQSIVKEPVTIIFTFIVLFYLSYELVFFSLLVLPLSGLVIWKLTSLLRKKAKQGQNYLGQILSTIDETLGGLKIIFSFNAQQHFINKFNHQNRKYERALRSMDYKKGAASPLSQFLGVAVFCTILYYGGTLVLRDDYMSPENFFVFIMLFANVISPLKSIFSVVANIQRGLVAGSRIFEVIDTQEEIVDAEKCIQLTEFNKSITLKNVSFRYEDADVLKGINLEIGKGKTVALVGASGGGKSTIINLIPRFYDVYQGEVQIDGVNVKDIQMKSLREQIGIVTQDSILFNDTIYNNIAFGVADQVTEEEVIRAAKIANAHEFIEQCSEGYQTQIGDNGVKLSGGQKQRLCIARAVLKNPPIMLLDEATSALDTEAEKLVQEALNKLMQNRTSVVVAHRLSTIQNADEIVVIEKGEVIEKGTHQELLNNSKVYKKLIEIQKIEE
ncbi:MAG: ABC transporter ATP-binding protein [Flavobacteriales bacterium]|nr:ABC transporter ATP-binding protein [Flavobacteriales bacterium]